MASATMDEVIQRLYHLWSRDTIFGFETTDSIPDGSVSRLHEHQMALVMNPEGVRNQDREFRFDERAVFLQGGTLTKIWQNTDLVLASYTPPHPARGDEAPVGTFIAISKLDFLKHEFLSKKKAGIKPLTDVEIAQLRIARVGHTDKDPS